MKHKSQSSQSAPHLSTGHKSLTLSPSPQPPPLKGGGDDNRATDDRRLTTGDAFSRDLQDYALKLGFTTIGWTPINDRPELREQLGTWLDKQHHGEMAWLARDPGRRADPRQIIDQAQTVISVTLNYFTPQQKSADPQRGWISRYAWGDDYHDLMLPRLKDLLAFLQELDPNAQGIAYVDTGPVLEKPWAAQAGLGWQGKHTNLIDPQRGSWFFIGEIVSTLKLSPSPLWGEGRGEGEPNNFSAPPPPDPLPKGRGDTLPTSHCGKCTKCIDICPTDAIIAPYQLDARRCISYLTIEHKGSIPLELRPSLGQHIYGCDLCQEVCPWNRFATPTVEPAFQPRPGNLNPSLIELMEISEDDFRSRFKKSPIKRIKRKGLLRNVAIALGNSKNPATIPALIRGLNDAESLVREHSAWALGEVGR